MVLLRSLYRKVKTKTQPESTKEPLLISLGLGILELFSIILIAFFLIKLFVFQPFVVVGTSMVPTLRDGDELYVNTMLYKYTKPQRGDVVVLIPPSDVNKKLVKRIIGLPGERLEITGDGQVIIFNQEFPNGISLHEDYLRESYSTQGFTITTLREDEYFIMGDNRRGSSDSRGNVNAAEDEPISNWSVPLRNIVGKVTLRVQPKDQFLLFRDPEYNL